MNTQDLVKRRIDLSLMSEIPDMQEYAEAWNKLAADFRAVGMLSNAALCDANWKRYGGDTGGFVRADVDGVVMIIPVLGVVTDCCTPQEAAEILDGFCPKVDEATKRLDRN